MSSNILPSRHRLYPTLSRGHACLPCRRRKLRCDGSKPICDKCIARGDQEDCEYTTDVQGLTRTQMLEETVSVLEARIRQIEHPIGIVSLRDPHTITSAVGGSTSALEISHLTAEEIRILLTPFLPQANKVGFFLNMTGFINLTQMPWTRLDGFAAAAVATACLWGSHLSPTPTTNFVPLSLLPLALHKVSNALLYSDGQTSGQAILGLIQAEVLLANYFYSLGRLTEGKYHSSAAVSLTLGCRLNSVGCARNPTTPTGISTSSLPDLGSAAADNAVQVGERINAFWTVYVLDKSWAVITGTPSSIGDHLSVTTPWPLGMESYEQGRLLLPADTCSIRGFLGGSAATGDPTPLALLAKASILFSRSSVLASRYNESIQNKEAFSREFKTLDQLTSVLTASLSDATAALSRDDRELLVACTIARAASIQLHARFVRLRADSRERCLSSARIIAASVQGPQAGELHAVDPVMAMLLSIAAQFLVAERDSSATTSRQVHGVEPISSPSASVKHILRVMSDYSRVCPLMASQAEQIIAAGRSVS